MNKLKELSAVTALNKMMQQGHFSICTVRDVAKMLGVDPNCEEFEILQPLHCVDYSAMPKELRDAIPGLINACLGVTPIYQFEVKPSVDITPQPVKRTFLQLVGLK